MLKWPLALMLFLIPAAADSHPGKTDLYGGHKCFKKCENWGLLFDEYHLHDKDGKPIRVEKKKAVKKAPRKRQVVEEAKQAVPEIPQEIDVKPIQPPRYNAVVFPREEKLTLNPLLLVLLALLLLLLLVRMRRRTGKQE